MPYMNADGAAASDEFLTRKRSNLMYSRGDQIIHPRYGRGTIVGKKKLKFKGKTRNYHIVELVGDRGEVMIPVDFATEMNIRPAISDLSIFERGIRRAARAELSDDYRSRQASIQKQIQTREPEAMATALRDLFWRERTDKLTSVEMKIEEQPDENAQPRNRRDLRGNHRRESQQPTHENALPDGPAGRGQRDRRSGVQLARPSIQFNASRARLEAGPDGRRLKRPTPP